MGLHTRAEWADRNPDMTPAGRGVGHVVIHHTAGSASMSNKAATLRGIEAMVTRRAPGNSQPLIAIDYNLMVFADGDVWAGRGVQFEDAATLRFNAQSVSICAVGNYHIDRPPPALLQGIAYAIQVAIAGGWFVDNPRITSDVIGHRDVGTFATACPGQYLEAELPKIRSLVGGATVPEPASQPSQEDEMFRIVYSKLGDRLWLTNWLTRRALAPGNEGLAEANDLIKAGVTDGAGTLKIAQVRLDTIPIVK